MTITNISEFVKTSRPALPQIYAYTTPEIERHRGWTKIGYTEQNIAMRLAQQTHTADVNYKLEWHGNATYEDTGETFRDTDFHSYLHKLNIKRKQGTEWFKIEPKPAHRRFYEFRESHGILNAQTPTEYHLRDEQERASKMTADYACHHENGEFLWNAKPRFGKTLTSYDLCTRMDARKILIVTNRPAIGNSWYDDYAKFFGIESGFVFISSVDALKDKPYCFSYKEYLDHFKNDRSKGLIEFVSLQDIKGAIEFGGKYDKLAHIAGIEWDILIIDEAHEGVDTYKTDVAFDHIRRKFTLHLSGTPFKAIANEKFPEDAIFNWTYADEQEAKRDWNFQDLSNPYAELPRLNLLTYQLSNIVHDKVKQGIDIDGKTVEYAFDLNEFFATDSSGHFLHDNDVDHFLDALTSQQKFPFSTPELRNELRHTFWLLNRVNSAKALARKLSTHPIFKDYKIILAAGDGRLSDAEENSKAFDKVRRAIASYDRTITLSVGQLTTGVTIPEWTAVLMLSNMKSPALYMQAAFRAQNPCLFNFHGNYQRKENAYVFDFDPARTLNIFEVFANDLYAGTVSGADRDDERKQRVRTLLNFFPVIGEDENSEMIELDAEQVLSIPRKIRSREVVRRGFMSDFLFQNISDVFHAPMEVLDVLQRFEPYRAPGKQINIQQSTVHDLGLNDNNEVTIPQEQVVGLSSDIFGDKVYGLIEDELGRVIDKIQADKPDNQDDVFLENLQKVFSNNIKKPLLEAANNNYGDKFKPGQQRRVARRIESDIDNKLNREVGSFIIEKNRIKSKLTKELKSAQSNADTDKINKKFEEQLHGIRRNLIDNLKNSSVELVKNAGESIIREVELAEREAKKQNIMSDIRDHLRGFSRTIPSFLMAYGNENTSLATFDHVIPPNVFKEVTSVTVEQFRLLRDGGDVRNLETGTMTHFNGHLFDPVVFDDSVHEFIKLRTKLANYLDDTLDEDIFDYVPPQKTNQIFTPRKVVVRMVDLFEKENPGCFDDPEHTFADLYMKSGLYITEIIKRLYKSRKLQELFPNNHERLDHILERQVFGLAPTEIIYQISTHYILGYNGEVGGDSDTNFFKADASELSKNGQLAEFVKLKFGRKL